MIHELDIGFLFQEASYKSFDDAVNAQQYAIRTSRARTDNSTTTMVHIIDYRIYSSGVELLLSDLRVLQIGILNDVIDWQFISGVSLSDAPKIYEKEVRLKLSDQKILTWCPDALLRNRINVPGLAIAPTETLVFLNIRGLSELMFGQMVSRSGERMLFFEEE